MSTGFIQKQDVRVHIRWMIRRDMPEVLQIEEDSYDHPWSEEDFLRCLRQRNCIGMVAESGERVIGFMIYELHKTRLHILNFAVAADVRRRAIGRQMIEKLIGKKIELEPLELDEPQRLPYRERARRDDDESDVGDRDIRAARESREPRSAPSRGPGREPPRSIDPFFDKPYEAPATASEPAWEQRAAPVARGLSPNIKPKKKVAALFGGKVPEAVET